MEIERAERDALGPVRRGPEPPSGELPEDPAGLPYDSHTDEEWDEPVDKRESAGEDQQNGGDASALPAASAEFRQPLEPLEPLADRAASPAAGPRAAGPLPEDLLMDDELFAEPHPASSAPAPHPAPGDETVEYRVQDALAADPARPAQTEDPLEETPEFLQDTPDHDRLWFEQRPPRDFDFDK